MGENDNQAEAHFGLVQSVIRNVRHQWRQHAVLGFGGGELRCRCLPRSQVCTDGGRVTWQEQFLPPPHYWEEGIVRGRHASRPLHLHAAVSVLPFVQAGSAGRVFKGNRKAALSEREADRIMVRLIW